MQQLVEHAAALPPPPKLPTCHSLLAPLLVEGRSVGIPRFGEYPHAHAENGTGGVVRVVVDDRKADRGRADIEAEDALGHNAAPLASFLRAG